MALHTEMQTQGNFLFRNRSYLPIIFLTIGLGVYLFGEYNEVETSENFISQYFEYICLSICLLGLLIRIKTVGHTPPKTSGRNTKVGQVADELNTSGLYSLVRHPLYVGNFFMWLGVAMLTENLWFTIAFILLYTIYYERIMYAEEQFLIAKFGDRYTDWSKTTPAFIPHFKNYRKPKYPFNNKKVIKKEKNGLVAIFVLFWLFEWASDVLEHGITHFDFNGWFYSAIATSVLYLILKIMKKRKMLN
ncbi:methyltransferase family protein [Winogradskyella flava]|uniref:methyltransferase family protein n=1 Tax=Winogradskyella flava TaxID=1884876 RepID=UPI0024909517|nr:isoprenylcysteine carboxylmethyltransferase family protein [Winogradskyella flava]